MLQRSGVTKTALNLVQFVEHITRIQRDDSHRLCFRGHNNEAYTLYPMVLREPTKKDDIPVKEREDTMLRDIIALFPNEFINDRTALDQLTRVQHYDCPTRLLDITWNPLVALYFATKELKTDQSASKNGEVILFKIRKDFIKYYDSDTISCIANLANLKEKERAEIRFDLSQTEFNKQIPISRLLEFIRQEKPTFQDRIVPSHLSSVYCVLPKKNNARIIAQSGAFLAFGMIKSPLDTLEQDHIAFERIRIPAQAKELIKSQLSLMAINDQTMFPEISAAANYIKTLRF